MTDQIDGERRRRSNGDRAVRRVFLLWIVAWAVLLVAFATVSRAEHRNATAPGERPAANAQVDGLGPSAATFSLARPLSKSGPTMPSIIRPK